MNKETELLQAAARGDFDKVGELIKEGVSLKCADERGRTPLHLASEKGFMKTVGRILDENLDDDGNSLPHVQKKFDENARDTYGSTALHLAARNGHVATVRMLLLDSDIDINATDDRQKTALQDAALYNAHDTVKVLLNQEANIPSTIETTSNTVRELIRKEAARRLRDVPSPTF